MPVPFSLLTTMMSRKNNVEPFTDNFTWTINGTGGPPDGWTIIDGSGNTEARREQYNSNTGYYCYVVGNSGSSFISGVKQNFDLASYNELTVDYINGAYTFQPRIKIGGDVFIYGDAEWSETYEPQVGSRIHLDISAYTGTYDVALEAEAGDAFGSYYVNAWWDRFKLIP
jgi:hypothetical protein